MRNLKSSLLVLIILLVLTPSVLAQALDIGLVNQDPDPVTAGDVVDVKIKIENLWQTTKDRVIVEVKPEYPFSLYSGSAQKDVGIIRGNQFGSDAQIVTFKLKVDKNAVEGSLNQVIGNDNALQGNENKVKGSSNQVVGNHNAMQGNQNKVQGNSNTLFGDFNFALGDLNSILGSNNQVKGSENVLEGSKNLVVGGKNELKGNNNAIQGENNYVSGHDNVIISDLSGFNFDFGW